MSDKTVVGKIECSNYKAIVSYNLDDDPLEEIEENETLATITVESDDELEEKEYKIEKSEKNELKGKIEEILKSIKDSFKVKKYEELEQFVIDISNSIDEELRN